MQIIVYFEIKKLDIISYAIKQNREFVNSFLNIAAEWWDCCEMLFFVIPAKASGLAARQAKIQNALISIDLRIPVFTGMTVLLYFATVPCSIRIRTLRSAELSS